MVDQPGADRSEQAATQRASPAASDDHHLGVFGQVDKGRHGSPVQQFTVDLGSITTLRAVLDDLDRVGDDVAGILVPALEDFLRDGRCGPRHRDRTGPPTRAAT